MTSHLSMITLKNLVNHILPILYDKVNRVTTPPLIHTDPCIDGQVKVSAGDNVILLPR